MDAMLASGRYPTLIVSLPAACRSNGTAQTNRRAEAHLALRLCSFACEGLALVVALKLVLKVTDALTNVALRLVHLAFVLHLRIVDGLADAFLDVPATFFESTFVLVIHGLCPLSWADDDSWSSPSNRARRHYSDGIPLLSPALQPATSSSYLIWPSPLRSQEGSSSANERPRAASSSRKISMAFLPTPWNTLRAMRVLDWYERGR